MILGISGKSGSGKSSLGEYLQNSHGFVWINCDQLASDIRNSHQKEIVELVKDEKIVINGKIDSKKLGGLLFEDKELLKTYNNYIYSILKSIVEKIILENVNVAIDSMFLPIMDVFDMCNYKILVVCDDNKRKKRILKRDNISEEYFYKRDSNGLDYDSENFDFIIDNNEGFLEEIENILHTIKFK